MKRLQTFLLQNEIALLIFSLALMGAIFALDVKTGYEISFSIFYLLPIALVTWNAGKTKGIIFSVMGSAAWLLADWLSGHVPSNPLFPVWNALVRLGFFLVTVLLLARLKEALEIEKQLSRMDHLTDMLNLKALLEIMTREAERCRRLHHPCTTAYIDLDNFKSVNDRFGHQAGDELLRRAAQAMKSNVRASDTVARVGGDEFILFLPEADEELAGKILRRVQERTREIMAEQAWPVTFSIGVAVFPEPPASVEDIIKPADDLMYQVKSHGKNNLELVVIKSPMNGA